MRGKPTQPHGQRHLSISNTLGTASGRKASANRHVLPNPPEAAPNQPAPPVPPTATPTNHMPTHPPAGTSFRCVRTQLSP